MKKSYLLRSATSLCKQLFSVLFHGIRQIGSVLEYGTEFVYYKLCPKRNLKRFKIQEGLLSFHMIFTEIINKINTSENVKNAVIMCRCVGLEMPL